MMRALTLTQPWAGLVASGRKIVENRPRKMIKDADFGKPFGIHASREHSKAALDKIYEIARDLFIDSSSNARLWPLTRINSAVIAVATLRDALYIGGNSPETTRRMLEKLDLLDQLRFTYGPTVYVLDRDVIALPRPVPCPGHQGFWTMTPEVDAAVRSQLVDLAAGAA